MKLESNAVDRRAAAFLVEWLANGAVSSATGKGAFCTDRIYLWLVQYGGTPPIMHFAFNIAWYIITGRHKEARKERIKTR